jgi:2-amino-4-hydroxy-6-hydroxymethyldihydropteridine diphosphokinase
MGSNLGDRVAALAEAVAELERSPGIRVTAVSGVYESEPWGVADQPAFANAAAVLDVDITPHELLGVCKRVEAMSGRVAGVRNGPRALDLDILLFGDETIDSAELEVPHRRLRERDFVVTPLLDVLPAATLPDGTPVTREAATEGRVTGLLAGPDALR